MPLFAAEMVPTWTDKEVLIAIGSVLATVFTVGIPVVLFAFRLVVGRDRARVRKLEAERKRLLAATEPPPADGTQQTLTEFGRRLEEAQQEVKQLLTLDAERSDRAATERQLVHQLQTSLAGLKSSLQQHESDLRGERRRIARALSKGGQTWTERVLASVPDFKPLTPEGRRTPIVSVLNLKGGVGKTTITANLAAALDGMGYRVLVLDLDLQGSLTGLFLPEDRQLELANGERLLEDFLNASFDAEFPNLLDYTQPILAGCESGLVPTSDSLAYSELNLTVRWLLREGNRDVRFLLRRELHLKRVTNRYDIVLLDCPPLLNVCCVNAVAASDYLLVPVMPSKQATARVPVLLDRLKQMRENVNPAIKVMGVVVNRTAKPELTVDEKNRLSLLGKQSYDIWGESVPQFETFIRQCIDVRQAEDRARPLTQDDAAYPLFAQLAQEVHSRLPTFCRPGKAPQEPTPVKEVAS